MNRAGVLVAACSVRATLCVAAGPGEWQTLRPLPSPLQELGVAALAGRIYGAGGFDSAGQSVNTVFRYDPAGDTWQTVAPIPAPLPLNHVGAVALDGKLYIIGGLLQNFTGVNSLYIFDHQTGLWSAGANMPTMRGAVGAAAIDGRIYVAGGFPPARANDFAVYNPSKDRWTTLPNMPTGRDHLGAAVVGGRLYAVGGRLSGFLRRETEEYDPATGAWKAQERMPTARGGLAVAAISGRIYTFGGEGSQTHPMGVFPQVQEFWPALNRWRTLDPMPVPRHGIGAAVFQGRVYIPGGATRQGFGAVAHHDTFTPPAPCDADCDISSGTGVLDIFDFLCFQNAFGSGMAYACDCEAGTGPGVCDIFDFLCFQNLFAVGCE